jgi:hypothetical protein
MNFQEELPELTLGKHPTTVLQPTPVVESITVTKEPSSGTKELTELTLGENPTTVFKWTPALVSLTVVLQPSTGTEELPELTLREHPTPTPADTSECQFVHNVGGSACSSCTCKVQLITQTSLDLGWWDLSSPTFDVQPAPVQRRLQAPPWEPLPVSAAVSKSMSAVQALSAPAWWDLPV